MTNDDIYEMTAIKNAIETNPASVHFNKMEKFAELWVKQMKQQSETCLLYTSPSPRDVEESRMPSSA